MSEANQKIQAVLKMLVYRFVDGTSLEFDSGYFDDWCVYVTSPDDIRTAPRDIDYFSRICEYSRKYGISKIWDLFVSIYEHTDEHINPKVFDCIVKYSTMLFDDEDALNIAIDFSIIYMGMIAEENKENAILKKRIKRLGLYQILYCNMSPAEAAAFSKGKSWMTLDRLCSKYGF